MVELRNPITGEGLAGVMRRVLEMTTFMASVSCVIFGPSSDDDTWQSNHGRVMAFNVIGSPPVSYEPRIFPFVRSAVSFLMWILGKFVWWSLSGNESVEVLGMGWALHGDNEKLSEVIGAMAAYYSINRHVFYFLMYFILMSFGSFFGNLVRGVIHYFKYERLELPIEETPAAAA